MTRAVPDFWERRLAMTDLRRLCNAAGVELCLVDMPAAACAPPPWYGHHQLFLSERLPFAVRPFVGLHELAHIVAGDSNELSSVILDERRYPLEDQIADAVGAIGITTPMDRGLPVGELAELLRDLVPMESRAWHVHRAAAVALLIREAPDLGRWGNGRDA